MEIRTKQDKQDEVKKIILKLMRTAVNNNL